MMHGMIPAPQVMAWATRPKLCLIVKGLLPNVITKFGPDPTTKALAVLPNTPNRLSRWRLRRQRDGL